MSVDTPKREWVLYSDTLGKYWLMHAMLNMFSSLKCANMCRELSRLWCISQMYLTTGVFWVYGTLSNSSWEVFSKAQFGICGFIILFTFYLSKKVECVDSFYFFGLKFRIFLLKILCIKLIKVTILCPLKVHSSVSLRVFTVLCNHQGFPF